MPFTQFILHSLFNMEGLKYREEYQVVAETCASCDFYLEPTSGIDLNNYTEILKIALNTGVKKVIPHIYSSTIDKATRNTRPEDVKKLLEITKQCL